MSVLQMLIWAIGLSAALLGLIYGAVLWVRKRAREDAVREVRRQFDGVPILALASDAEFNGLNRSWDSRWRGCGVLILTRELLYFRSWQRNLDLTIAIERMEKVAVTASGDRRKKNLTCLQVSYRGMDDQVRVATWHINRPEEWVGKIGESVNR
jgi:hypothetical protein